eukprot:Polyplicarium_translucidae@DN1231_c0_g1_i1.p2
MEEILRRAGPTAAVAAIASSRFLGTGGHDVELKHDMDFLEFGHHFAAGRTCSCLSKFSTIRERAGKVRSARASSVIMTPCCSDGPAFEMEQSVATHHVYMFNRPGLWRVASLGGNETPMNNLFSPSLRRCVPPPRRPAISCSV